MSIGKSGRVVIEIDPRLKKEKWIQLVGHQRVKVKELFSV